MTNVGTACVVDIKDPRRVDHDVPTPDHRDLCGACFSDGEIPNDVDQFVVGVTYRSSIHLSDDHETDYGFGPDNPRSRTDSLAARLADPDGNALEEIMAGPMVVTQWINTQYYFASVDNAVYGSRSKVTHNPVGNIGVYQGNGGDLMTGLPLQSLMAATDEPYHQPIRLSTIIHAPVERFNDVLADHEKLTELLDNDWLSLTVVDPTRDHRAFHYEQDLEWIPVSEEIEADSAVPNAPMVTDD